VAEVNIYGGRARELHVMLDPQALADRSLSHAEVIAALRAENRNISAGSISEGKRDYRVRVVGQFASPNEVMETVVAYRQGKPVFVKDLGTVEVDFEKRRGFVRAFGQPSLALNAIRQTNANVVEVMTELRARVKIIEEEILPTLDPVAGPLLRIRQVYDETTYIDSARGLVTGNLWLGGLLAGAVLMLFLRSFVSTGIVAISIPVSIIATFLAIFLMGRTLNVISLAGLAFAVGMVVDNSIVVIENIYRRMQLGETPAVAAYRGAREVWGAVLASTLTTVAVFIPVLTIQDEAGQLFFDIALAMAVSVTLSLVISITVIPSAASKWLRARPAKPHPVRAAAEGLFGLVRLFAIVNTGIASGVKWMNTAWRGVAIRPVVIAALTAASYLGRGRPHAPLDYLPAGNRNLVFGGLLIPPGLSVEQRTEIATRIEGTIKPYSTADLDKPETVAALAPIFRPSFDPTVPPPEPFDPVPIDNFFIGAFGTSMFIGATSQDPEVVIPIGQLITNAMGTIPDSFGGAQQTSLFGRGPGGGSGNSIDLEISGPNLARVNAAATAMLNIAWGHFGRGDARPDPANFQLQEQELQVRLNERGRELGLTTEALGVAIRALFDGAFVGDYKLNGETIDLAVLPSGGRLDYKEQLRDIPIATPAGPIVPVDSVVDFVPSLAPQAIKRIEELESVTIQIVPPEGQAIEEVMDWINTNMIAVAREQGLIDRTMRIRLEGTAAKLDEVRAALFGAKPERADTGLARAANLFSIGLVLAGLAGGIVVIVRSGKRVTQGLYGMAGLLLLTLTIAGIFLLLGNNPQFLLARFIWALLVTYLLMCALFESFLLPLVIMFSVPLAVVGGFAGLRIVHNISMNNPTIAPQQLDVLTMLGFVILIGVVVNNAILIVHQSLNFIRGAEGEPVLHPNDAIAESVRTRIRPIMMSVLTSVGGMLPLVLFPGAGSEMYRGLGSVVVGGLIVSTVFTLVLVPLMFGLVYDMQTAVNTALGWGGGRQGSGAPSMAGTLTEGANA
jgi:HAE1 family hydrophobic/amphiphilic exporter-1